MDRSFDCSVGDSYPIRLSQTLKDKKMTSIWTALRYWFSMLWNDTAPKDLREGELKDD